MSVKILHVGKHLSLVKTGHWEFARRHGSTGVVGLIAVTPARRLLLVEQFRPPLSKRVIELPAGLAGDIAGAESESLAKAAGRELLEETGYEAKSIRFLTEGPSSAGLTDETITFFLMTDLVKVGPGGGDDSEDIVVHEVPLTEITEWLEQKRVAGIGIDPKIYAGLFWTTRMSLKRTTRRSKKTVKSVRQSQSVNRRTGG